MSVFEYWLTLIGHDVFFYYLLIALFLLLGRIFYIVPVQLPFVLIKVHESIIPLGSRQLVTAYACPSFTQI